MQIVDQTLLKLLLDIDEKALEQDFYSLKLGEKGYLNSFQMAHLYVNAALMVTIMEYIKEQLWLKTKAN